MESAGRQIVRRRAARDRRQGGRRELDRLTNEYYQAWEIARDKLDAASMVQATKAIASLHGIDKGQRRAADSVGMLAQALMSHASHEALPSPGQIIEDAEYEEVSDDHSPKQQFKNDAVI